MRRRIPGRESDTSDTPTRAPEPHGFKGRRRKLAEVGRKSLILRSPKSAGNPRAPGALRRGNPMHSAAFGKPHAQQHTGSPDRREGERSTTHRRGNPMRGAEDGKSHARQRAGKPHARHGEPETPCRAWGFRRGAKVSTRRFPRAAPDGAADAETRAAEVAIGSYQGPRSYHRKLSSPGALVGLSRGPRARKVPLSCTKFAPTFAAEVGQMGRMGHPAPGELSASDSRGKGSGCAFCAIRQPTRRRS